MSQLNRRDFLARATATGIVLAGPRALIAAPAPETFTFLFITDCHLQPELNGVIGTDMAFKHARGVKADFAIQGGDHVFDALAVPRARAVQLYDLYGKTEQDLGLKVYHTIGNHDCFGVHPASNTPSTDPEYGRKMYQERFGKTNYSFDHKGVHFMVLDSIGLNEDHTYEGRIDPDQIDWMKADLAALPPHTPVIVVSHIPLISAYGEYLPPPPTPPKHPSLTVGNAWQIYPLFEPYNVIGVLQGHVHVNETVWWHGIPYISSGAVCGDWWKGAHVGTPEGYTVVTVANGKLTTRYETYGFKAVAG